MANITLRPMEFFHIHHTLLDIRRNNFVLARDVVHGRQHKGDLARLKAQYFADVVLEIVFGSRVTGVFELLAFESGFDSSHDFLVAVTVAVVDDNIALRCVEEISRGLGLGRRWR